MDQLASTQYPRHPNWMWISRYPITWVQWPSELPKVTPLCLWDNIYILMSYLMIYLIIYLMISWGSAPCPCHSPSCPYPYESPLSISIAVPIHINHLPYPYQSPGHDQCALPGRNMCHAKKLHRPVFPSEIPTSGYKARPIYLCHLCYHCAQSSHGSHE